MIDRIKKYIVEEWTVISGSPASFVLALILISIIMWFIMQWGFSTIILNKDSEISLLTKQRDDYRDKLGGASPSEAKARIDALEGRIKQIEPLKEQIEQINKYVKNMGGATPDEAKTRIGELEDRLHLLEPRRLTPKQRNILTEKAILSSGTTYKVEIVHDGACYDCSQYSSDIGTALKQASNWEIREAFVLGPGQKSPKGLLVILTDAKHPSPEENVLMEALKAAGIEFDLSGGRPPRDAKMSLLVTAKVIPQ